MLRPITAALVCLCVAQTQEQRFRSSADLLTLFVTARALDGHLVPGLRAEDFEVVDNGRLLPVVTFSDASPPLNVLAMFQTGYIPGPAGQKRIREVANSLVNALWSDDRARIGSFGVEFCINPILSGDKSILNRIVDEELWARWDHSPLWDALSLSLENIASAPGRKVLLVFSNGVNDSHVLTPPRSKTDVASTVEATDVTLYAIALNSRGISRELRDLAENSGGGAFVMGEKEEAARTMLQVLEELHHQYVLGVESRADVSSNRHVLGVRCRRPGVRVHSRGSYVGRTKQ